MRPRQSSAVLAALLVGLTFTACDKDRPPPPAPEPVPHGDFGADGIDRLVLDVKQQLANQQVDAARVLLHQLQAQHPHMSARQQAETARLEALFAGARL